MKKIRIEAKERIYFLFFFTFFSIPKGSIVDLCDRWNCCKRHLLWVFHFVFSTHRTAQEGERDWERKKNDDGTWSLSEKTCSIRKRKSKDVERHITRFLCFPRHKQRRDELELNNYKQFISQPLLLLLLLYVLSLFDRLLLLALILFLLFCAKKHFFLVRCLSHEGELWVMYKFPSFFFACFTRHRK